MYKEIAAKANIVIVKVLFRVVKRKYQLLYCFHLEFSKKRTLITKQLLHFIGLIQLFIFLFLIHGTVSFSLCFSKRQRDDRKLL